MPRSSEYVFDNKTSTWTKSEVDTNEETNNDSPDNSGGDNLTSSNSDKNSGTGIVEKEYNTIELNTLQGTLSFIATKDTIKIKAGDTVKLEGLGKYLSGDYYVKEVTRQISSSGYSHSAVLIKTDFGKSLKVTGNTSAKEETKVASPPQADSAKRTHTVKKGESLWKIAKQYYGDGKLYNKIFDANTNQIVNKDLIYIGQVLVIP